MKIYNETEILKWNVCLLFILHSSHVEDCIISKPCLYHFQLFETALLSLEPSDCLIVYFKCLWSPFNVWVKIPSLWVTYRLKPKDSTQPKFFNFSTICFISTECVIQKLNIQNIVESNVLVFPVLITYSTATISKWLKQVLNILQYPLNSDSSRAQFTEDLCQRHIEGESFPHLQASYIQHHSETLSSSVCTL